MNKTFTARIRRMRKILFTPGEVPHLHLMILPLVPCPFWGKVYPSDWSQVPSGGSQSQVEGLPQAQAGGNLVPGEATPVPLAG